MGVRVLHDRRQGLACLYGGPHTVAFGPLVGDNAAPGMDAGQALRAFLAQCTDRDPFYMTPVRLRTEIDEWQVRVWNAHHEAQAEANQ